MILKNLRLWGRGEPVDILVDKGKIVFVGSAQDKGEDFGGRAVFPGFVESHCHLDKTLSLGVDGLENQSGTLLEAIERWRESKTKRAKEDYKTRARAGIWQAISRGTTCLRSHLDMDSPKGLEVLEGMLELRAEFAGRIDLEFVALGMPGTPEGDAVMEQALEMGIDVVGGAPHITPDPVASMKSALDLAERYDRPVDLHMDEHEDPRHLDLETLAEMVRARGLQGRVTSDHNCSLTFQTLEVQSRVIEKVAEAGIHMVSLPAVNLVLQGKGHPPARGLMPIKALRQAGINVALGSDNVRDPFQPMGNYDLLWQANVAVHAAHLTMPEERVAALEMITRAPAKILGLRGYGLEVGCAADLVILDALTADEALAQVSPRLRVYKAGRLIYKQEVGQSWL
ncbi:amidohydrolase family protein [Meiothermus sp.]|uniref:amidohydrolase family protein n=1 Tax=Meiothermus sp. TaxID=1955249 RepID=UPI0021DDA91C|nr:amidohydrolase family protein [Meiothermus sp.]GIW33336.1 MAG: cytosine deaminase [Meiothermus sp.]